MKKNIFKLGILAIFIIAGISSCQKDQVEMERQDGEIILKTGEFESSPESHGNIPPYIIPGANKGGNRTCEEAAEFWGVEGGYEFSTYKIDYEDGEFEGTFSYWFEGVEYFIDVEVSPDGTYVSWDFDVLPEGWCLADLAVIVKGSNDANVYFYEWPLYNKGNSDSGLAAPINASGNPAGLSNLTFCFNLVECYDGNGDGCWKGETAFGGDTGVNVFAPGPWFFYFIVPDDLEDGQSANQGIYAGQIEVEGAFVAIHKQDGQYYFNIFLGSNMELEDVDEPVKIQGYTEAPTVRPPAGQFTTYKGTEHTWIPVEYYPYYIIHLDVLVNYCP